MRVHSTHNKGESAFTEGFFWVLKNKIYKYMAWISKKGYIDKLANIIHEYCGVYHRTIKIKTFNINFSANIDFD